MPNKFEMHGPVQIDIIVYFTDGKQVAKVTYGHGAGMYIPPENMPKILVVSEKSVKEQLGEGWRLCTREEFQQEIFEEKTGSTEKISFPGGDAWDKY